MPPWPLTCRWPSGKHWQLLISFSETIASYCGVAVSPLHWNWKKNCENLGDTLVVFHLWSQYLASSVSEFRRSLSLIELNKDPTSQERDKLGETGRSLLERHIFKLNTILLDSRTQPT